MNGFVIALGMFDGIHLGHRALLGRTAALAESATSVALTFSPHPRELLCGAVGQLSDESLRIALIESCGIDRVDVIPFTADFAAMPAEDFAKWLWERYDRRIEAIVCGYDYRFGKGAEGDGALLRSLGGRFGFRVEILDPVLYGTEPCSSTRVREALLAGDLDAANAMLDRPYAIRGRVVHHFAIGRTIGFPTANVDPGKQLLPMDGVYASALIAGGRAYAAVSNVGTNPTVDGSERTFETFVPDETLALYGSEVTVLLLKRLRGEVRFADREALAAQIGSDARQAKKVYQESEKSVYKLRKIW